MSAVISLGHTVMTPGVERLIAEGRLDAQAILFEHERGNWGAVDDEDRRTNDEMARSGGRVLSAWFTIDGEKVWCITEADRHVTTLLLPDEY